MNTISYLPSTDEMFVKFHPLEGKKEKQFGHFKLWWNDKGDICALDIKHFTSELKKFREDLSLPVEPNIIDILCGKYRKQLSSSEEFAERKREEIKKEESKWRKR